MLPFRAMSQTEVAASFRHVSGTPNSLELLREGIQEIVSRRRLIRYLVQADMKKRGSDTILGNIWWILDPLLQMLVYLVFIEIISKRSQVDYPLFIFASILPWKWFSSVVTDASSTVLRQERLIKQIAFPKLVLPVATSTAELVGFAAGMVPLAGLLLLIPSRISIFLLWVPVIAAVQYVFTLAAAIIVGAANVFVRDLGNAMTHLLRLWWFMSPGLYSLSSLDDISFVQHHQIIRFLAGLNPFAVLFEAYRSAIYGSADGGPPHNPDVLSLVELLVASTVLVAISIVFFKRVEPSFAKVL
jgi:homopolymeric O-antigen transport system permease protein